MDSLVVSNLFHRRTRTGVSIAGVALGVVLVLLTAGLANGFLAKEAHRNSAVLAEIMIRPSNVGFGLGFEVTAAPTLPVTIGDEIKAVPGVADVVPVAQYLQGGHLIDGIDYNSFTRVSDMRAAVGRPPVGEDEVMVDGILQRAWKLHVGDHIDLLNRSFRVVGISEPESLARFKLPIGVLQKALNSPGLCSMLLVKVAAGARQEDVAERIKDRFPDLGVVLTGDLPILFARGTPALHNFLRVVLAVGAIISALVILLTMYTTVTERTRQIGILKSLGARKAWIAGQIETEALFIGLAGMLAGVALSLAAGTCIERLTPLRVELEASWFAYAIVLSLASTLGGALYPALRAANQDPVRALSYE